MCNSLWFDGDCDEDLYGDLGRNIIGDFGGDFDGDYSSDKIWNDKNDDK